MTQQIREQLQSTLGTAYTLERELGGGGMSRVFVAEETSLRRKVVVKVLPPELTAGVNVERFNREILLAAQLQHPHIVPVLSAGETHGLPYYTMPFVDGESLRARLGRGGLGITEVVNVLRDVARALAYAHERGVVHRDIKPDNVLLTGGSATVTDFGIAKAISASRTAAPGATLTQVGTSIGTPTYMAPEQAAGDPTTDHRADIYSFGCLAYELLAARPPFVESQPRRLLAAHMGEKPKPVTEFRPDTPGPLADLVMRCLEKEADDRPQRALDLVHVLETVTSSGAGQAMPPVLIGGPGMFRKALAIYAVAFGVVAIVAKAAIVGIGLPDWVFPGSLIVMALGLPVVLWTGYVQRVARRAATVTPTYTPGGTPSIVQGTIATMALKAAPKVSWYKTARGGMYAFAVFIAMIAAFMGMRAFGIGPFASLIATGALTDRNKVIITDFAVSGADSALGRVVGDAIRAGLGDSRVFTLVSPAEVGAALQRMQQPASARVALPTAQQIALREGAKAIVDGDVTLVGTSYIVAVRLVTADSARELASFRGTASSSDGIINVADELSRKLRAKAGESLRRVQATPQLAYASTSSLEALRKYSEAVRANDSERDYMRAISLLREAVALDSNFAEGWRKLAVAIRNSNGFAPSASDSAIRRAFALSGRMTERERDAVLGYYYQFSPGYDRDKAIAAYRRMLARGDSTVALTNIGVLLNGRREYAKAESVYRAAIALQPGNQSVYSNLLVTLNDQAKLRERDSLLAVARVRFPDASTFPERALQAMGFDGRFDEVMAGLDSARKKGDRRSPSWAVGTLSDAYGTFGRLREQQAAEWEAHAIDSSSGRPRPRWIASGRLLDSKISAGLPFDAELKTFDADVERYNIDSHPTTDRPYAYLAEMNAKAGRVDKARQWIARYDAAAGKDTALRRWDAPSIQHSQAHIAQAERKWTEATALFRQSDRRADGPINDCDECVPVELMRTFAMAGMADSAIATYEAYRKTAWGGRPRKGPDRSIDAPLTEALAKIYDSKGDVERAAELYRDFVDMWKKADPELQSRVAAARDRLKKLAPVEGRKP